jgi:hypothetical protein
MPTLSARSVQSCAILQDFEKFSLGDQLIKQIQGLTSVLARLIGVGVAIIVGFHLTLILTG